MKRFLAGVVSGVAAVFAAPVLAVPVTADVIAIVDESGSMAGEHAWIGGMIAGASGLDARLIAAGLTGNQYGLVGFGGGGAGNSGRALDMNPAAGDQGQRFGTAAQFSTATSGLVITGGTEDGYAGINFALNNYTFRAGSARNLILVTDEDRDNTNGALTFASITSALQAQSVLLNVVVNNAFRCGDGSAALGISAGGIGYKANGAGGFTTCTGAVVGTGAGTTNADYVQLALGLGGAAWDLNALRTGGLTAQSFTAAFVDIKVQEITTQAPEPGSLALLGLALAGLGFARRKLA